MNLPTLSLRLPGLHPTARALVGVSGGRDSVALLRALIEAGFSRLTVCHLDHGLRGRSSSADARFVERLAAGHGLDFVSEKADVRAMADSAGQSLETAARNARLAFFARIAKARRCRTVLLAHHAGDQAETLLFNLFRGAGRTGLAGMAVDSEYRVDSGRGRPAVLRLVRPMLHVTREEIDAFVAARSLRFREDASNALPAFTRNRIRHELLPLAEAIFGRDVRPALVRTADILRAEDECLAALAGPSGEEMLSVTELRAQPPAVQRRRILAWLRAAKVPEPGFEAVERVRALLDGPCAKTNLPGGWHARRREKRLFLEPPARVRH